MNRLMHKWPLMAEAGEGGGGNTPTEQKPPEQKPTEQQQTEQKPPEQQPTEQKPTEQQPTEQKPTEQKTTEQQPTEQQPTKPENLMDDDPNDQDGKKKDDPNNATETAPTEEEIKSFRDGIKAIDLGEGVTFDDPALDAMQAPLMELAGKDPKKAEGLVKAYTDYRRAEIAREQEKSDAFVNGLVAESRKRFGDDLKNVVALAKAGGRKIFGDELWNQFKSVPQFANNPDIIERLAAFGRSVKDDPGAVKKETGTAPASRDWRENMYGDHK